jgi:hypothetical protein
VYTRDLSHSRTRRHGHDAGHGDKHALKERLELGAAAGHGHYGIARIACVRVPGEELEQIVLAVRTLVESGGEQEVRRE